MSQRSYKGGFFLAVEGRFTAILRICLFVGMAFIMAIMLLTVVHVIGRYGFSRPIIGLAEISGLLLVTGVFMGGAYTALRKGHIAIGFVVDRFSERTQAVIDSIAYIICLVVAILAIWQSFVQGTTLMESKAEFMVTGIPQSPFLYMVGVGWGLLCLSFVILLINSISKGIKK